MSWAERALCPDMKHPNHVFLLQNIFDRLSFGNIKEVREMKFLENENNDVDPWNVLLVIEDNARPALSSCLGWGSRKTRNEGKFSRSSVIKKKRGKEKKKKCGEKVRKNG